jgi:peptide-methionine (S)-S-oxide reductase
MERRSTGLEGEVRTVISRSWVLLVTGLGLLSLALAASISVDPAMLPRSNAAGSIAVPAPDVDELTPASAASETTVLAGGCFWGVQGLFQHVKGVTAAESGYAGGSRTTADYADVGGGQTGHAESVRITYDPKQVTYGQLLQIFFSVVQDPTELNRQGPDEGTQYRSVIFFRDPTQQRVAESYIAQLSRAAVFPGPIVTQVAPDTGFFPAESYHQNFMNSNPSNPYIAANDIPKLNDLKQLFPALYRDQPVLMLAYG